MLRKSGFAIAITSGVIVGRENDTIFSIANLLKKHNIGAVVILKGEKIVGILSERDIVRKVICNSLSPKKVKAREIMTREVVTVDIREGLNKIHEIMCTAAFRHLDIVRDGKPIGTVSSRYHIGSLTPKK